MNRTTETVFQFLYDHTQGGAFVTTHELMGYTGLSENELRPHLEDLKDLLWCVEHEEGFQVTGLGLDEGGGRWA